MSDQNSNHSQSISDGSGVGQQADSGSENAQAGQSPTHSPAPQSQENQDVEPPGHDTGESISPNASSLSDQDAALQEAIEFDLNQAIATGYRPRSPDNPEGSRSRNSFGLQSYQGSALSNPTTIIGAPLGHNLRAAEALVRQWEQIYEENLQEYGEEAVEGILEQLERARADRAALDMVQGRASLEESLGETEMFRNRVVAERIGILEEILETAECEGEIVNIQAAIQFYRNGIITPSDSFALIYAGHLVDFAPSYASFTHDRAERLDRYFAEHGPGWLWFEPPLTRDSFELLGGGGGIIAMKSTWAMELESPFGMGEYHITMGFKRIDDINHRKAKEAENNKNDWEESLLGALRNAQRKPESKPGVKKTKQKKTANGDKQSLDLLQLKPAAPPKVLSCIQSNAVRLYFRMLLDTGATLPMLYKEDLAALGINLKTYAAVSSMKVSTASGVGHTRVYELHVSVSVCDTRTARSLVDEDKPVWPDAHPSLGGILPVAQIIGPGSGEEGVPYGRSMDDRLIDVTDKAEGKKSLRLSGLLPLKTCYMQSTPGIGAVWLGEDRRDVLGAQRMPGQMRWEAGSTEVFDPGHPRMEWLQLQLENGGNPSIVRMVHEVIDEKGGRVVRLTDVEEDGWHGRSRTSILGQDGKRPVCEIEPRQQKRKERKVVGGG